MTAPLLGCPPGLKQFYLGPAGNLVLLTIPDTGYKITLDQGRVDHALLGGPHAVQRLGKARFMYELDFSHRSPDQADLVTSIFAGMLGIGPYYLIDPAWRNMLPAHISGGGRIEQTSAGWVVSGGGSVAYTAAITPPPKHPLAGVQDWTPATSSFLWLNASAANITESGAPPVNAAEPFTGAVWIRAASGAPTVQILAYFTDASGASLGTQTLLGTTALSTTWQRLGGGALAGTAPAGAVTYGLAVKAISATPPHIYVSAPDIQQITATVVPADNGPAGTSLPQWVLGLGVPKLLPAGMMNASPDVTYWRRSHVLTLVPAE